MTSKTNAKAARRSDREVNRLRNAIVGTVLLVAAVVLGAGLWYSLSSGTDTLEAGQQYGVIEGAPARKAGAPITVQEFFSYACPHCRDLDPMIEEWKKTLPADVRFERIPATFSPMWTVLAQTYYALQELGALERNHERLFRAIHDNGREFLTIEAVADFVDGRGTTRQAFLTAANGPKVREQLRTADLAQRNLMIGGVPTLVVAGRYVVGMRNGRKAAIDIMDQLIAQERAGTLKPAAPAQASAADPD